MFRSGDRVISRRYGFGTVTGTMEMVRGLGGGVTSKRRGPVK